MKRRRLLWAALAVTLALAALEGGFRLAYRLATPTQYAALAQWAAGPPLPPAARFTPYPAYFYAYDPSEPGINAHGFWGPDPTDASPPGAVRIFALGDSTVAGLPGWLGRLTHDLSARLGRPVWAAQLAAPGWTLREVALAAGAVLPIGKPDIVLVHAGANDLGAAVVAGFKADYSHWRQARFGDRRDLYRSLRWRRRLFDVSRAAAYLARAWGQPLPTAPRLDALANRADAEPGEPDFGPAFAAAVGRHLNRIVVASRRAGARVVLTTQPSCPDHPQAGGHGQFVRDGMAVVTTEIRNRARTADGLIDLAASFAGRCDVFSDGIHVSPEGDALKARLIADGLAPLLKDKDEQEEL